jgi:uncharacterized MAPEG superfamily protein
MELVKLYSATIAAFGTMAFLMFFQVLVADVVGLRAKHLPGAQIPSDHNNLLFRVSRTVANTNETVVIFAFAVLFCMLSGVSASTTAYATWTYVVARFLYALCYYFNFQLFRSVMFGVSLLSIAALLVAGASKWCGA